MRDRRSTLTMLLGANRRHQRSPSSSADLVDAHRHLFDVSACVFEGPRRFGAQRPDARVHRKRPNVWRIRYAPAGYRVRHGVQVVDVLAQAVRVVGVVPGHRVHHVRGVLHCPRHAALERKQRSRRKRRRPGDAWQAARRALEAVGVGPRRRDAQRPAAVRALRPRHEAIGDGRGGAPGRPAAVLRQVPRVACRPVQVVVAGTAKAQRRAVGLADRDRPRTLHAQREVTRAVDNVVAHGPDTAKRAFPARQRVRQVLDRSRQPGQRRNVLVGKKRRSASFAWP